jgi:hypothetical protein
MSERNTSSLRYRKGELGYGTKSGAATAYNDATWSWARTKFSRQRIIVRVALNNVWRKELNQEFTGGDSKAADTYARALIHQDEATDVWVHKQVYMDGYLEQREVHDWIDIETYRWLAKVS